MEFKEVVKNRYSCKKYSDRQVEADKLTAILEGLPAGLPLDEDLIRADLARRQIALGAGGRMAIETDRAAIIGGVLAGRTTGAPVALAIANANHAAWKGKSVPAYTTPRPGHADFAAAVK